MIILIYEQIRTEVLTVKRCSATILLSVFIIAAVAGGRARGASPLRVLPYLQNPATNAITVKWFSEADTVGQLAFRCAGEWTTTTAPAVLANALDYHSSETPSSPSLPYSHRARLTGLIAGTAYEYVVTQDGMSITNTFRTAPAKNRATRFIVYADSETEPASTGARVTWPQLNGSPTRRYPVDQTRGYQENLHIIKTRAPDFIVIAGDLVQAGGRQSDWDEFWRHNAGTLNDLAGAIPIMPALGNHEYYGGPRGGYEQPGSEQSVAKYFTYFEMPANEAANPAHNGRYYRMDYGPVTLLVLDLCNGDDSDHSKDTSTYLKTADGCQAPDFNPGTAQYAWLEEQLASAQTNSQFTFVAFHHIPYSCGPHGLASEPQSGVPARVLTPLFLQYGVDAVLCGHDESYERSTVTGIEQLPDGDTRSITLSFYDLGIGGDGLRGAHSGVVNDKQAFFAHSDAPEVWSGEMLVSGGKHYGHLEVNVQVNRRGNWEAVLTPAYAFPIMTSGGAVIGFERRTYDDVVTIAGAPEPLSGHQGTVVVEF